MQNIKKTVYLFILGAASKPLAGKNTIIQCDVMNILVITMFILISNSAIYIQWFINCTSLAT